MSISMADLLSSGYYLSNTKVLSNPKLHASNACRGLFGYGGDTGVGRVDYICESASRSKLSVLRYSSTVISASEIISTTISS